MTEADSGSHFIPVQATYYCDICGEVAAKVKVDAQGNLVQEGFISGVIVGLPFEPDVLAVRAAILSGDVRQLFDVDPLYASFFCPECGVCYCKSHWHVIPEFDDDFPGWYDCSRGTCPKGHERMVDD